MGPGRSHWAASEQLLVVLSHRPLEVAVRSITAVEVIRLESLVFVAPHRYRQLLLSASHPTSDPSSGAGATPRDRPARAAPQHCRKPTAPPHTIGRHVNRRRWMPGSR